jgi:hypothetical protein
MFRQNPEMLVDVFNREATQSVLGALYLYVPSLRSRTPSTCAVWTAWLNESAKRVIGKFPNVVQHALTPIGRYSFKLFCGVAMDVYEPSHA